MPICKVCSAKFDGEYRQKYCSDVCRLMGRVEKQDSGCWYWSGGKISAGYGVINVNSKFVFAHRMAYTLFVGEIPDGLFVCHKCDNPSCVNPAHLFVGSNAENAADMARKGRAAWSKRPMPPEIRQKITDKRRASNWKPSKEQIEKSVAARAEKLKDPEWREAVYSKMRGANNPNYGKKLRTETREKLEESHWSKMRGKPRGPMPEETKKRISEAHRRRGEAQ